MGRSAGGGTPPPPLDTPLPLRDGVIKMALLSISRPRFQGAIRRTDATVEPHPLWEHEGRMMSLPRRIASFDLADPAWPEVLEFETRTDHVGR